MDHMDIRVDNDDNGVHSTGGDSLIDRKKTQPSDSLELIDYIEKELNDSFLHGGVSIKPDRKEIISKINPTVESIIGTLKNLSDFPPSVTATAPFHTAIMPDVNKISFHHDFTQLHDCIRDYMYHSWVSRRNLAAIFLEALRTVKHSGVKIEEDDSGYIAANLMVFSDIIQKLTETHKKSIDELHTTIAAVLANGAYPPAIRTKIQSLGSLYLYRHHTKCVGCLNGKGCGSGNTCGVVVGKSLLQGVPLCYECMKVEEDSMLGRKTYLGENVLDENDKGLLDDILNDIRDPTSTLCGK